MKNSMIKKWIFIASMILSFVAFEVPVNAGQYSFGVPGNTCNAYLGSQAMSFDHFVNALHRANDGGGPMYFVCGITMPPGLGVPWNGTNYYNHVQVTLRFWTPVNTHFNCTLSLYDSYGTSVGSGSGSSISTSSNQIMSLIAYNMIGQSEVSSVFYCIAPEGSEFFSYDVDYEKY